MKDRSEMMNKCMKMMKQMGCMEKDCSPEEFMSKMRGTKKAEGYADYAPDELRVMFEDWLLQMEDEVLQFTQAQEKKDPEEVAREFKISKESAEFILRRLDHDKKKK